MKKIIFFRRLSQWVFFLFFITVLWSTTYPLHGFIPSAVLFVFDPLIMLSLVLGERIFLSGIFAGLLMLAMTLILGRFFCGWLCPLGTLIDVAGALRPRWPRRRRKAGRWVPLVKYVLLCVGGTLAMNGVQIFWVLDPIVIMGRFISLNMIPAVTMFINSAFVGIIQRFELYGMVNDIYRTLRMGILGVDGYFPPHAGLIGVGVLVIVGMSFITRRLWCRMLCPLGALYALVARFCLLRHVIEETCDHCCQCIDVCRMDAIHADASYDAGECIMCMDCVAICPPQATAFKWNVPTPTKEKTIANQRGAITRRHFLVVLGTSIIAAVVAAVAGRRPANLPMNVIRPPGSLNERAFLDRCVRCGNCMKVCVTNGLQPCWLETGIAGLWTPQLVPEVGYCEYNCRLCGTVCPTGAIADLPLPEKQRTRLGRAEIDRSLCVAWATKTKCLVCEEHCPVAEKAIKTVGEEVNGEVIFKPVVETDLCIGCGICQNVCPAQPERAIIVNPAFADRL